MSGNFASLAEKRRTIYTLGKTLPISDDAVVEIIKQAIRQAPSAFNSQSSRALILLGKEHEKLWELTREQLRKLVPADKFQPTADKMDSFAAAAGSVLFFEDQDAVKELQASYPSYAENFPTWSEHGSAIAQYAVWLALAEQGIGANIQHYNPLIDEDIRNTWHIPASWTLRTQMNFGPNVAGPVDAKTFIDNDVRFVVAK